MSRTSDRGYQRNRARLKRQPNLTCVLCGQPIDVTLPKADPMSFESDHVIPIALGGHNRGELAPMHKACNRKRGIRDLETVRVDVHSRRHY